MSASNASLTDRSVSAVKWSYLGVAARVAVQVVVQIALARLLGPDILGLFALVFIVIGVGSIVVDLGLGAALVQEPSLSEDDVRWVFTRAVLAGLGIAGLTFIAAPLVAQLFGEPRMIEVLRGIAPVFVLHALALTPLSLLKR